jgi:hypothetical protein
MGIAASHERRRALRAPVHGMVVLRRHQAAVRGAIENLSLSGVLVRSHGDLGDVEAPDDLEVELRLPSARPMALTGRVVRCEVRDQALWIAIRFEEVPADCEDTIEDQVVDAFVETRRRPVVVIEGQEERRRGLAEALRERRMTPLTPRTPLEAVDLLASPERHVEVCLVSARFGDLHAREIEAMIRECFPWVRIVLAAEDDAEVSAEHAQAVWDDLAPRQPPS